MQNVTFDALTTTFVVILAICGAVNVIGSTVKLIREAIKPKTDTFTDIADRLEENEARLDTHDKAIAALKDGQKHMCEGVVALLNHELHNGNSAEMQRASDDITAWMIRK